MGGKNASFRAAVMLILIFLLQASMLLFFIGKDNGAPDWDESWHAMISLNEYRQAFDNSVWSTYELEKAYPIFEFANNYYPHFFHWIAAFFYVILSATYKTALLSNLFFLAVLTISSYFIGKKLYNKEAGLFISFIVSTIPLYSSLMRVYLIDFALSSMVSLGLMFLIYSDCFRNTWHSVFFAVVSGFGMLTKWTYMIYLIVPLFFCAYNLISASAAPAKKMARIPVYNNLVFALISFLIICMSWYTPQRISSISSELSSNLRNGMLEKDPSGLNTDNILFYFFEMVKGLSFFYFILFAAGAVQVISIKKRTITDNMLVFFLASIAFTYLFFTAIGNKDPRYIAPVFLYMAIIAASHYKKIIKHPAALAFIVILGLLSSIALNSPDVNLNFSAGKIFLLDTKGIYPEASDNEIFRLLDMINKSADGNNVSVCIIAESKSINDVNIPYYSMLGKFPVEYMIGNGCDPEKHDYVITGKIEETWRSGRFRESMERLNGNRDRFELIGGIGGAQVYKKIS